MEKIATVWAGPNGERATSDTHGAEHAWKVLWDEYSKKEQAEHPEIDPAAARAQAYQRMIDDGFKEGSPRIKVKLLQDGWVVLDDKSWEIPTMMAKTKDELLREEDLLMQFLSKGPVNLVYDGGGGGVQIDMNDVEETPDLSQAIEHAKAKVPASESSLSNFNLGFWSSARRRVISYFK